jgi:hypothetical protein
VDGVPWVRLPVRTERFGERTPFAAKAAWYVGVVLTRIAADVRYVEALRGGWWVVASAKAVAITEPDRVTPLWRLTPRPLARVLARLARGRLPRLGEPWTMQVALAEGGPVRVGTAVLAAYARARSLSYRLLPDRAAVSGPRPGAVAPADGAVVRPPAHPDEAATALVDALRYSLPPDLFASFAGCAIVSVDERDVRVHGHCAGPGAEQFGSNDARAGVELLRDVCADNPAGQAGELTPFVLVFAVQAPHVSDRAAIDRVGATAHK